MVYVQLLKLVVLGFRLPDLGFKLKVQVFMVGVQGLDFQGEVLRFSTYGGFWVLIVQGQYLKVLGQSLEVQSVGFGDLNKFSV